MDYKVVKYKKKKKKRAYRLQTYEPKKRIDVKKEHAVPLFLRICHKFVFIGGIISFLASSLLMAIKGAFQIEKKVKDLNRKGKVIELKVKE